jgi:hypothetical protein
VAVGVVVGWVENSRPGLTAQSPPAPILYSSCRRKHLTNLYRDSGCLSEATDSCCPCSWPGPSTAGGSRHLEPGARRRPAALDRAP